MLGGGVYRELVSILVHICSEMSKTVPDTFKEGALFMGAFRENLGSDGSW